MKELKIFKSNAAYENWNESFDNGYESMEYPTMILTDNTVAIDCFIERKTAKAAIKKVRKIFETVLNDNTGDQAGWLECIEEEIKNGFFGFKRIEDKDNAFIWGLEQQDEKLFYFYLNLKGIYAGRHTTI